MISELLRSMLPKIDPPLLLNDSAPDTGLLIEPATDVGGMKAGASGRNLGPKLGKLKSLCLGENTGALTLILDGAVGAATGGRLNWLEVVRSGATLL
jgi:hypothetical protein